MSGLTDRLRQVAGQARDQRDGMDDVSLDHYQMPPSGAFVGEHTGFMVVHPVLVGAMLDVIDAAEYRLSKDDTCWCPDPVDEDTACGSCRERDALARFCEVAG